MTTSPAVVFRLDPDLRDALWLRAQQEGRTVSEVVREAVWNYLLTPTEERA